MSITITLDTFFQTWKPWWNGLSPLRRFGPVLLVAFYWAGLLALGGLRGDLIVSSVVPLALYYLGPKFKPVFQFTLPLFLTSILYDTQRYYADYIRGPIHVREPYEFDKRFFGISTADGVLTPNEWWQKHTHGILDFFTGLAYIIFVPVYFAVAAYFRFVKSRTGTNHAHPRSILYRSPQITWAFLWVNLIGWSTYYWYAASPPWYVALYGLGPARLDVQANLAGCARFDTLIGYNLFQEWYGRSADVHGAIPSLHIAYPLMSFYYALRFGSLRVFTLGFYLLMCFAAVYLNHHYILDILWGSSYAILVAMCTDGLWNHKLKKAHIIVPGDDPMPLRSSTHSVTP